MQRTTKLVTALGALAIVVGACGGGASPTPAPTAAPTEAPTAAPSEAPSAAPTAAPLEGKLEIWHTYASGAGTEKDTYDAIVADIMAKNPGLTITTTVQNFFGAGNIFDKYALETQTGGGPDMFIVPNDSTGAQVRQNLLQPLDELATGMTDAFYPLSLKGCTVEGKLYCVPESLKAVGVYYDNAAVPTPPATTDELLAAVKAGTVKAGFSQGSYHNFGFWAAFGGQLMDDTGKCIADTTGVDKAFQFFADLKAAGATYYPDYAKFADAFKQGQLNYIVDGPWASGGYKEALGDKLAVGPLPNGPDGRPSQPLTGTDGWFINPNSTNQELAFKVGYLMSTEYAQQWVDKAGHIPAYKDATVTDPITKGFAQAVATGFPRPQVKELDNFWGNFDNALNSVLDKGTNPTEAVKTACDAMNKANGK
jgi:arabinogalactan oligomer/maltooligosaccharide transport system substrate-binding protein